MEIILLLLIMLGIMNSRELWGIMNNLVPLVMLEINNSVTLMMLLLLGSIAEIDHVGTDAYWIQCV